MAANRTQQKREADLAEVARLYLEGRRLAEIAARVGVHWQTVRADLEKIRAEWLASSLRDFDAQRAQECAKLDRLELEAWDGYRASQAAAVETTVESAGAPRPGRPPPQPTFKKKTTERYGDTDYLMIVYRCIDRRCKLMGLDAPTKISPTGPAGAVDGEWIDWDSVTDAELARRVILAIGPGNGGDGQSPGPAQPDQTPPTLD